MPKKVEDCVKKLMQQGYTESEAWAICKSSVSSNTKNKKCRCKRRKPP